MFDIEKLLTYCDEIVGTLGTDEENSITAATEKLVEIKETLSLIDGEINTLNDEIERLNNRNRDLQSANNHLMREIAISEEERKKEEEDEKLSKMDLIDSVL